MKPIRTLVTSPQQDSLRILPSALQLFIPFFHWIASEGSEAGRTDKKEVCRICSATFSVEDPYCPKCAEEGYFIHITYSE